MSSLPAPRASAPPADPFAKTVFGDGPGPMERSPLSPQAPAFSADPRQPAAARPVAAPVPSAYVAGALVLVHWADGNRYPATVLHATATHVLVVFPTGQQQWIDVRYVSTG